MITSSNISSRNWEWDLGKFLEGMLISPPVPSYHKGNEIQHQGNGGSVAFGVLGGDSASRNGVHRSQIVFRTHHSIGMSRSIPRRSTDLRYYW
jgi:hypothetical protein